MDLNKIVKKIRNSDLSESDVLKYGRILITEFAKEYHKKQLTLTDVGCSLNDEEAMTFDEVKHLENKHNVLNKIASKQNTDVKLQFFENGKWVEVPL